jgi:LPS-assembly protein
LEVRIRSGGKRLPTRVVLRVPSGSEVRDQTAGARVPDDALGEHLSEGEAFKGEIVLTVGGPPQRTGRIDVSDELVSAVGIAPGDDAAVVTIFVRQPVRYRVRHPSAEAELVVTIVPLAGTDAVPRDGDGQKQMVRTRAREVSVDAESVAYDQSTDTVIARGSVTLTREDVTLQADEVRYDRRAGVAAASGRVVLVDPELVVEGDEGEIDLIDETGWLDRAEADFEESRFSVAADRIEKRGGPHYHLRDGVFTTCRCGGLERPSWSLACDDTDIELGSYGTVRGATFRVKDVPVLHVPFLVFPATTERQSGFLFPRFGYSNRRGFQYEQPFFWEIDKSSDATVAIDVETQARAGIIGEYRYVRSRETRGAFAAAYYNEEFRADDTTTRTPAGVDAEAPENRFALAGRHDQPAPGDSHFYLDLFAVSDDLFLREINNFSASVAGDLRVRTSRFTRSRTGVIKTWHGGLARFEGAYYQDLIDPQELALQPVPELELEHAVPLLGGRVVGRLAGHAVDYQREDGFDGVRAEVAPELFVPVRLGSVAFGSLRGLVREQAYYLSNDRQVALVLPDDADIRSRFRVAGPNRLTPLDRTHSQESAEVQARLASRLARVYDVDYLGLDRVRHTIEPEIGFLYVPNVSRPLDRVQLPSCASLPEPRRRRGVTCNGVLSSEPYLFDTRDAINRRSFLSYGLSTRLYGRLPDPLGDAAAGDEQGRAAPREHLRAQVLHGWDASRELVDGRHTSDVDLGFRLTPSSLLGLGYDATVSAGDQRVLGQAVGAVLREPWRAPEGLAGLQVPSSLRASYRFVAKDVNDGLREEDALLFRNRSGGVEEVAGGVYVRLGNYMGISFLARYDLTDEIDDPHFLERSAVFRLLSRCNCWVLDLGVTDRFDTNETAVRVQFTLVGLGSFGGLPGLRNYVGMAGLGGGDDDLDAPDVGDLWR